MAAKNVRPNAGEQALLDELKQLAEQIGIEVREERLLREVGYRVRSGGCRVREKNLILLDRGLPVSAQIDILAGELAARPLETVYISPAARRVLEGAAPEAARASRQG
ncbi:MAG TPA: hypothetical protein VMW17_01435 [Candidatus Binatia bacterium]|nr:hypothetical protein [Candidatus Binatia bacterium]